MGVLAGGGELTRTTRAGHRFGYADADGDWRTHLIEATTAHVVLLGRPTGRKINLSTIRPGDWCPRRRPGDNDVYAIFANELDGVVELFWESEDGTRASVGAAAPGEQIVQLTRPGATFSFDVRGERRRVVVDRTRPVALLAPAVARVDCRLRNPDLPFRFDVFTEAAPRGAGRLLQMVRTGFFEGLAFHRVVDGFVASFGVAKDFDVRDRYAESRFVAWKSHFTPSDGRPGSTTAQVYR